MGTIISGSALGDITGKIGNLVASKWLDMRTVRSTPTKHKKKKNESQKNVEGKEKFAAVAKFLGKTVKVIPIGYQHKSKEVKTSHNLATSYHLQHAVIGEYPNYSIDYSKVKFSNAIRPTENGWNAKITREGNLCKVNWMLNPFREKTTQLDDKPVIVCYYRFNDYMKVFGQDFKRSSLVCSLDTPTGNKGEKEEVFCWMFFISADGKLVSKTEYLGTYTIIFP